MTHLLRALLHTSADWGALVARLTLGAVIFPHGAQKMLGLFGGQGFPTTMGHFQHMGLPAVVAFLVIVGEFFGSLGLIAGFLSRFCAFSIGLIMAGAIAWVHWPHGFFMNWFGQQAGEGFEYHLLAIGLALVVVLRGGAKWSLDALLSQRLLPSANTSYSP
jgi:putative oxidoreductase